MSNESLSSSSIGSSLVALELCCTSDFNGDGALDFIDVRIYRLWSAFVDKSATLEEQLTQIGLLYGFAYPTDPGITALAIPELDCADYSGDKELTFVDVRFFRLWDAFVDQSASLGVQLGQMASLYLFAYPTDPPRTAVRIPAIEPDFCTNYEYEECLFNYEFVPCDEPPPSEFPPSDFPPSDFPPSEIPPEDSSLFVPDDSSEVGVSEAGPSEAPSEEGSQLAPSEAPSEVSSQPEAPEISSEGIALESSELISEPSAVGPSEVVQESSIAVLLESSEGVALESSEVVTDSSEVVTDSSEVVVADSSEVVTDSSEVVTDSSEVVVADSSEVVTDSSEALLPISSSSTGVVGPEPSEGVSEISSEAVDSSDISSEEVQVLSSSSLAVSIPPEDPSEVPSEVPSEAPSDAPPGSEPSEDIPDDEPSTEGPSVDAPSEGPSEGSEPSATVPSLPSFGNDPSTPGGSQLPIACDGTTTAGTNNILDQRFSIAEGDKCFKFSYRTYNVPDRILFFYKDPTLGPEGCWVEIHDSGCIATDLTVPGGVVTEYFSLCDLPTDEDSLRVIVVPHGQLYSAPDVWADFECKNVVYDCPGEIDRYTLWEISVLCLTCEEAEGVFPMTCGCCLPSEFPPSEGPSSEGPSQAPSSEPSETPPSEPSSDISEISQAPSQGPSSEGPSSEGPSEGPSEAPSETGPSETPPGFFRYRLCASSSAGFSSEEALSSLLPSSSGPSLSDVGVYIPCESSSGPSS
jgi:insulin receptor substrate 1